VKTSSEPTTSCGTAKKNRRASARRRTQENDRRGETDHATVARVAPDTRPGWARILISRHPERAAHHIGKPQQHPLANVSPIRPLPAAIIDSLTSCTTADCAATTLRCRRPKGRCQPALKPNWRKPGAQQSRRSVRSTVSPVGSISPIADALAMPDSPRENTGASAFTTPDTQGDAGIRVSVVTTVQEERSGSASCGRECFPDSEYLAVTNHKNRETTETGVILHRTGRGRGDQELDCSGEECQTKTRGLPPDSAARRGRT